MSSLGFSAWPQIQLIAKMQKHCGTKIEGVLGSPICVVSPTAVLELRLVARKVDHRSGIGKSISIR